jgi:hypothetical protein
VLPHNYGWPVGHYSVDIDDRYQPWVTRFVRRRTSTPEFVRVAFTSRTEWEHTLRERRVRSRVVASACAAAVLAPLALLAASVGRRSTGGLLIAAAGGLLLLWCCASGVWRSHRISEVLRGDDRPMSMRLSWSHATGSEPVAILALREPGVPPGHGRIVFRAPISGAPPDLVTDDEVVVRVRGLAAGTPMVELRDGRLLWPCP